MKLSNLCQNGSFLRAFYFLVNALKIIFIIVPIIIIITIIISIGKVIISGETDDLKKVLTTSAKKLIAGIIIFLLPSAFTYIFSLTGESFDELNMCMTNATLENIKYYDSISAVISALENMEGSPTKANVAAAEQAVNKAAGIIREDDMISFVKRISDADIKANENELILECKAKNGRYENGICMTIKIQRNPSNSSGNGSGSGNGGSSGGSNGNSSYDPVLNAGGTTQLNILGGSFTVVNTPISVTDYVNAIGSKGVFQASNTSKYGDKCLGFAYVHTCGLFRGSTAASPDDGANYNSGGCSFATYVNDSKEDVLEKVFNEVANGRPVVLHVNGNKQGTSRHFVTVVGFKSSVTNASNLAEQDLLIIDSWDGKIERMDTPTSRFMTSGKDCGKKDYSGYRIQYLKS